MRDPRNWARPATALVVGGAAGAALVLLRARHRGQHAARARWPSIGRSAESALRDLEREARRLLGDR
jgi:hypothetical protein